MARYRKILFVFLLLAAHVAAANGEPNMSPPEKKVHCTEPEEYKDMRSRYAVSRRLQKLMLKLLKADCSSIGGIWFVYKKNFKNRLTIRGLYDRKVFEGVYRLKKELCFCKGNACTGFDGLIKRLNNMVNTGEPLPDGDAYEKMEELLDKTEKQLQEARKANRRASKSIEDLLRAKAKKCPPTRVIVNTPAAPVPTAPTATAPAKPEPDGVINPASCREMGGRVIIYSKWGQPEQYIGCFVDETRVYNATGVSLKECQARGGAVLGYGFYGKPQSYVGCGGLKKKEKGGKR